MVAVDRASCRGWDFSRYPLPLLAVETKAGEPDAVAETGIEIEALEFDSRAAGLRSWT